MTAANDFATTGIFHSLQRAAVFTNNAAYIISVRCEYRRFVFSIFNNTPISIPSCNASKKLSIFSSRLQCNIGTNVLNRSLVDTNYTTDILITGNCAGINEFHPIC